VKHKLVTTLLALSAVAGGLFLLSWLETTRRDASLRKRPSVGTSEWQEVSSTEGRYRLKMPGTPEPMDQTTESALGIKVRAKGHLVERPDLTAAFFVFYHDSLAPPQMDAESYLEAVCEGIRERRKGVMRKVRAFLLGKVPAREATFEFHDYNRNNAQTCRVYHAYSRLYVTAVTTLELDASADYITTFLDSMRLGDP
jgi:hypothetical protein